MKKLTILTLVILSLPVAIAAGDLNDRDSSHRHFDRTYDNLLIQIHDIRYDLLQQIQSQQLTIDEQRQIIVDLQLKIKDLESDLFQTTQSLRNLELEVWDMKEPR